MWSPSLSRGFTGLLLALLLSATFAGCFGDEEAPDPAGTTDGPGPTDGTGPGSTAVPTPGPDQARPNETEQVPEAHYHHYWGEPPLSQMVIFNGLVTLDHEECFRADSRQEPACVEENAHIGSVIFNLESDGDQVDDQSREPHLDGHADTVFTGTSAIVATFTWDSELLGSQLRFYYKPANSPAFLPRTDDPQSDVSPIYVTMDDPTVEVALGRGMSDPAHQFWVSRWEFMLVAEGGPQPDWPFPVKFARGDVQVEMTAINGGKASIDPPHPDQWEGQELLGFGVTSGSFELTSARVTTETPPVDQRVVHGDRYDDIEMPVKAVVPVGAEKLVVRAWVNATDEASKQMDWGLKYHGANTLSYTRVDTYSEGESGERVYEIPLSDAQADPPYEKTSYFRFGFYPIVGEQAETGHMAADYALSFEVHRKPEFTYFF